MIQQLLLMIRYIRSNINEDNMPYVKFALILVGTAVVYISIGFIE